MATRFSCDDRAAALSLYSVNHAEWDGPWSEFQFWKVSQGKVAIPWGVDRGTAITSAATALGLTVNATSPWLREQQFWAAWLAKPPVAAP